MVVEEVRQNIVQPAQEIGNIGTEVVNRDETIVIVSELPFARRIKVLVEFLLEPLEIMVVSGVEIGGVTRPANSSPEEFEKSRFGSMDIVNADSKLDTAVHTLFRIISTLAFISGSVIAQMLACAQLANLYARIRLLRTCTVTSVNKVLESVKRIGMAGIELVDVVGVVAHHSVELVNGSTSSVRGDRGNISHASKMRKRGN